MRDSILYKVVIIGEAAGAIPRQIQTRLPDVPWAELKRMRNYVAHVYHAVNHQRVWALITADLPELLPRLKQLLATETNAPRRRGESNG